jgi:hypothetical protein
LDPVPLPDYLGDQCFFEYTPRCPVLFLTADDVLDAFPFRELVNHVEKIELKVTKNGGPLWLLTQPSGKKHVVYPFALHRFYDELDDSNDFKDLKDPEENQEFLVYHFVSTTICSLIPLKTTDGKSLFVSRFSKMEL